MDWRKPISFSLSLPSNHHHHHHHIFSFLFLSSTKKRVLSAVLAALASLLLLFCLLFDASSPSSLLSRFLDSTSRTTSIGGEANASETSPPAAMAAAKEAILVNASETSPPAAMEAEKEAILINATASSPPAAMAAAKEAILVNATASSPPAAMAAATEAILVNATASSPPATMAAAKEAILVNATASSPPAAMAVAKEAILVNATPSGPAKAVVMEEAKLGNSSGGFVGGEVNGTESAAAKEEFLGKECDLFDGKWVKDESMPYYLGGACPYIDRDFDCHQNGRPDDGFLKWRWKPRGCAVPRLNATDFLERLRGKRIIYVGDSLNRNMWESLVCILRHSVKDKKKVYEVSGRKDFKTKGYYSFRFEDYKCSVDYVRSPFLVRELFLKNRSGDYDEKLRVDLLDETTSAYLKADIVVFNTGHWWTHEKTSRGIDYYQEGNYVYPSLNVMDAYKKALTTWARWVDKNINSKRTQVFFRGYSLTHFRGGQWNSGGQCHKETEPIFNETYLSKYPSKMKILEQVLHQMKTPVIYLNISTLTDYRKDGHPSIYRKKYNSMEEQITAEKFQDCSHWCLPGVPDAWNELVYASLLMAGKGSWKR